MPPAIRVIAFIHSSRMAGAKKEAKQILDTATFGLFFNGLFVSVFA